MPALAELTLDEMLADPIVHLMMARDGVAEAEVRGLIARVLSLKAACPSPAPQSAQPNLIQAA